MTPALVLNVNLTEELRAEGAAAPTSRLGLRILNRKPRPLQAVHVVHFRPVQERYALRIYDDLHVTLLDHRVIVAHIGLERSPVLVCLTHAALHILTLYN